MLRKLLFLFLFLLSATTFGQIGGKSVYQFLNLAQSPRQAALGGKTVTVVDYDVNQAFYNPATINAEMHNRLSANYGSYFGEVSYGTAAYAYTYDRHLQTFHAGISYVNYGTFEGRDELGNQTSDFTGSEAALSLGYAYNLPWTDMYVGANAKLISSTLESYNSWGAAVDLGFLYVDYDNDINYGLTVRNLGFQIKPYQDTNEKLLMCADAEVTDACLLASVQMINHFKISAYGTAAAFANTLGMDAAAIFFHKAEVHEKQIDDRLTQLAQYEINFRAKSPIVLPG